MSTNTTSYYYQDYLREALISVQKWILISNPAEVLVKSLFVVTRTLIILDTTIRPIESAHIQYLPIQAETTVLFVCIGENPADTTAFAQESTQKKCC